MDAELRPGQLDGPRPLPPALRARLEDALLSAAAEDTELAGLDEPRPLPPLLRARLEDALLSTEPASHRRRRRRRLVHVAPPPRGTGGWWTRTSDVRVAAAVTIVVVVMVATFVDQARRQGGGKEVAAPSTVVTPSAHVGPPPFAFPFVAEPAGSSGDDVPVTTVVAPASGPAIRIATFPGDARQVAGFRAYLDVLNRRGGIEGRPVRTTVAFDEAVAVVNLSGLPVADADGAPAAVGARPLLETLTAPEAALRGRVRSLAGALRRQAHLAVDAALAGQPAGLRALVVQAADGVFADEVPAALEEALVAAGAEVTRVTFSAGAAPSFPDAEVALLSLDTPTARQWLRAAAAAGYAPAAGVAGVVSLLEPSLLPDLPEGTIVVSPYLLPTVGPEDDALRAALGHAPGAAEVHGWVTAKSLAVALWRAGAADADDPDEVAAALGRLDGYQDALTPPYAVRPGTTSRTPEGAVFVVTGGTFSLAEDFRADGLP